MAHQQLEKGQMSTNLHLLRKCCNSPKSYLIIYDGADTPDLPVLVCIDCYQDNTFQKFIKKIVEITDSTDAKTILRKTQF